jgi:hypothetical protein
MIDLDRGQIHLWMAFFDEIGMERYGSDTIDCSHLRSGSNVVGFISGSISTVILSRALVRTVLSRYAAVEPQGVDFRRERVRKTRNSECQSRDAADHLRYLPHEESHFTVYYGRQHGWSRRRELLGA